MDFMKLFGTVVAVLFHPGSASKLNGERICRRGTERPCYKAFYIQDSRRRLTFEDARQACRSDGGELLSVETDSEQQLMERFIQELKVGDGDFWIGLHRSPQHHSAGNSHLGCPSQYSWLDGSKAKYRNWQWDEPSCGTEMCVVLYHQPSAPRDEDAHFLFKWNDENCSSKNNFVCKYREDKVPIITGDRRKTQAVPSLRPSIFSTTEGVNKIEMGLPESSVSFSENTLYVSYILYATIPALVLLLLAAAGFFCYKHRAKRRKTETESYHSRSKQWMSTATSVPLQGPYAFSDVTKLPHNSLDCRAPAKETAKYSCTPSYDSQYGDYENVASPDKESGFVTNDIYEPCRGRPCRGQTGWVENEIYG